jgi:SAM-dependent methyltransferase
MRASDLPIGVSRLTTSADLALAKQTGVALKQAMRASGSCVNELFAVGKTSLDAFSGLLGGQSFQLLEESGLVVQVGTECQTAYSARIVDDLIIISDPFVAAPFPDLYLDPLWEAPYLRELIVPGSIGSALDMGCGSGILALSLAARAKHVAAIDLNPRAIATTRFNAALNGIDRVEVYEGDLFAPVAGRKFDFVVFNSPTGREGRFGRSLLEAGEVLVERFFREVFDVLSPSGIVQLRISYLDYPTSRFHDRLASWLPEDSSLHIYSLISFEEQMPKGICWRSGLLTLKRGGRLGIEREFLRSQIKSGVIARHFGYTPSQFLEFEVWQGR